MRELIAKFDPGLERGVPNTDQVKDARPKKARVFCTKGTSYCEEDDMKVIQQ